MRKIFEIIEKENRRQNDGIELIASENYVSKDILAAVGSILTNKYAEGYPGKRYYGGCEFVDEIENIAIDNCKKLFNVKHVNVQPHSGSHANMVAYRSILNHGDTILAMNLSAGGHLTHSAKVSFVGKDYNVVSYGVNSDGFIDYDEVFKLAKMCNPKLIVCGASAYSRIIDFEKFKEIADSVGAFLMADIAHIAGLVATGLHPSPIGIADIVTTTTHKTLRGPRGGVIMTNNDEIAKKIDKTLFPGTSGGPLMHVIAGKAICFYEALQPEFKKYQEQVVKNASILSEELKNLGYEIISGGTDNHLFLLNTYCMGVTGKEAEEVLGRIGITVNKNSIPNDTLPPAKTSGIRIGTPAITTRGFKERDIIELAKFIDEALKNMNNEVIISKLKDNVSLYMNENFSKLY